MRRSDVRLCFAVLCCDVGAQASPITDVCHVGTRTDARRQRPSSSISLYGEMSFNISNSEFANFVLRLMISEG